jgi:hypothetical protein
MQTAVTTQGIINVPANTLVGNNTSSNGCALALQASQWAAMLGVSGALPTSNPGTPGVAFLLLNSAGDAYTLMISTGSSSAVTFDSTVSTFDSTVLTFDRVS